MQDLSGAKNLQSEIFILFFAPGDITVSHHLFSFSARSFQQSGILCTASFKTALSGDRRDIYRRATWTSSRGKLASHRQGRAAVQVGVKYFQHLICKYKEKVLFSHRDRENRRLIKGSTCLQFSPAIPGS